MQRSAQGAGADLAGVGTAHHIDGGQALEVDAVQAAVHFAHGVIQPGYADAVERGQHAVAIQTTDVDAVVAAVEVDPGFGAARQVIEAADLAAFQRLRIGLRGGGQRLLGGGSSDFDVGQFGRRSGQSQ